ncbi:DUF2786 domain-containing protein [Pseudomonas bharatica]|uniref:DUF2786 domain-containing protein n=1 Tax=Pseudomonas bharatica TaxID=2692112 RepID=UPI001F036556|nr:DUF2786 domain-containing protein [Pseudomonas bharatica]
MAKGKGSNPNEAEIALRQAHKLMEAYNLEMGDVLASMAGEVKVAAGSEGEPPAWRVRLARVCAEAFGSTFIINAPWFEEASFIYIGCGASPELACYAYQVLERQLQKARRDYLATQKRCKRSTKVARGTHSLTAGSTRCRPRSSSSRASKTTLSKRYRPTWTRSTRISPRPR